MPDGSPSDDLHDSGSDEGGESTQSATQTVEEVEAIWRNRVSGKDRAHNAEIATLKSQIRALEAQQSASAGKDDSGPDPRDEELTRLRRELDTERASRIMDARKAKYPFAADTLDDATMAAMPEEKLAALNARLDDTSDEAPRRTPNDPNRATRRTNQPTSPDEKSIDDLKSDLRKYEGEFINSLT